MCCAPVLGGALPAVGVSRDLARDRARIISNVSYELTVTLAKKAATMPGHAIIRFDLTGATPIVLDFRDGKTKNLVVNGAPDVIQKNNGHIIVRGGHLHAGANRIDIDFESEIAESNRAITRYVDREDGSEYIYTLFVPMDASQAFPCFDQPDLKARFTLHMTAPPDWTVITNGTDKPISTYLFAFAAGPFEKLDGPNDPVPLRLYVRRTQLARAKEEWPRVSETVQTGMRIMSAFFAQPFPFPKYDEVLIPSFAYGGMEHAGATFLREDSVLFRSAPTVTDYNRRDETTLHELAHQWFGDLVTMRWFDDVWLKEGFAQFMAYHTLAEMEPPAAVWKRFYESIKPAAYRIDSTHGTTPIYQDIPNLKDAKSAYGAIVYQKAPALLRVLEYNIGENAFREGVRAFLREHAWSNATWSDLIDAFSRASGKDLKPWADAWVRQRGMPQIDVDWGCANGKISSLSLRQSDVLNEGHTWPVQTQILLGYKDRQTSVTVDQAVGQSCPDYVFGNAEDHAYGRFLLDARSQQAVLDDLPHVTDPFVRSLLWGALWDNMRDLRMTPSGYADLALQLLPGERDPELASSILGRLRATFTDYLSDAERAAVGPKAEDLFIAQMSSAPTTDLRIGYFRSLVGVATSAHARDVLKEMLAGRIAIPDVPLKERDRWNIVSALIGQSDVSGPELLASETKRDTTEDGRRYRYDAAAGFATAENKTKYFGDYVSTSPPPEDWITSSLDSFNRWNQTALTLPFLKPALDALPQMKREKKIFFVNDWLAAFIGGQDSAAALKIVDDFLAQNSTDPDLRLKVLESRDELARTARIRAMWARQ